MTLPRLRAARTTSVLVATLLVGLAAAAPSQAADWRDGVFGASLGGDRATPRIVGGSVLPTTAEAPYTVAIQTQFGDGTGGCSGTVLDPTHILTAAHCVVEDSGTRATPDQVAVAAGTSDVTSAAGVATGVVGRVGVIRVHPRHVAGGFFDDVAVLTLTAPLPLTPGKIEALPLAPSGTNVAPGRAIRITGYGITGPGNDDFGTLRSVDVRSVIGGSACSSGGGPASAPGAFLCTQGSDKGACSGDSGGNATIGSAGARKVIGVTDIADSNCRGLNFFANVAAPEIRTFIDAALAEQDLTAAQTPLAPRGGRSVKIAGTARAGRTVTCRRGSWTKGSKFRYAFLLESGSKQINRGFRTKKTYKVRSADRGRRIFCAVEARSAGGKGISVGANTKTVAR